MMNIIDRYVFNHVVLGSFMVVLILALLDTFFVFLGELDTVGKGNYGYLQAFLYIVYTLPRRFYDYAPTAVLLGSLVALGGLAARSELVAIRAAGMSVIRFVWSVLKAGLFLAFVIFMLGEWIAPAAEQEAETIRTQALSQRLATNDGAGLWVRDGKRFVHASGVLAEKELLDVSVYEFDGLTLKQVIRAKSAKAGDAGWIMHDVRYLNIAGASITQSRVETETWDRLVAENLFEVLRVKPKSMSARNLFTYVDYLKQNNLDSSQYELAFWNRFMTPLSTLVMLLLALPFIFGSQRTGSGGQRIFIGIMLGIGYFLSSNLLNQMGLVYGMPPFLSAVAPLLVFGSLGMVMLKRV